LKILKKPFRNPLKKSFKKIVIIFTLLILALSLTGCESLFSSNENTAVNPTPIVQTERSSDPLNSYSIEAEVFPDKKTLTATEKISYVNTENLSLSEIYLHIYPNAFRKKTTAPFLFDQFDAAYPDGFSPGNIDIKNIKVGNKIVDMKTYSSISGKDSTILKIKLDKSLKPGARISLEIDFSLLIPPAAERFGIGANYINLGNWYPIVAVYDQNGWNLDPYYSIGDPFYSDVADYNIKITAPKKYKFAASGVLTEKNENDDTTIWTFASYSMRDFAIIGSDKFFTSSKKVGDTNVISYFYKNDSTTGKEALDFGVKSLKIFNEKFGTYPYPTYSVVETSFPSGMEYPGLVYISDTLYQDQSNLTGLAITTIHETGHQYFYALVGNDQIDEAWLDESFATYSEIVYYEKYYGTKIMNQLEEDTISSGKASIVAKDFNGKVVRALSTFNNWDDYGPAAYSYGATTLIDLRKEVGDKVFWNIMKSYFTKYKFKIATTNDFINVSELVSGKDLSKFFNIHLGLAN